MKISLENLYVDISMVLTLPTPKASLFLISIYQINEQQFSHVLIGSCNSEYPWLVNVLRTEPRWPLVLRHFRKTKFER